jgi:hypothetical protein
LLLLPGGCFPAFSFDRETLYDWRAARDNQYQVWEKHHRHHETRSAPVVERLSVKRESRKTASWQK